MMRYRIFILVIAIAAALPADAATFSVRRTENSATVRGAGPHASVSGGPYDDDAGTLSDPQSYYYIIDDDVPQPVALSIHKNLILDTVRLGFDDTDPGSAPVDPSSSSVGVAPATIPADGVTMALVTILPCDVDGTPLGSGLDISLDPVALFPGVQVGPVVDQSNGLFSVQVLSTTSGQGTVVVTVEGLLLADEPTITYEFAEYPTIEEQMEAVIDSLEDLALDPDLPESARGEVENAAQELEQALDELAQNPPDWKSAVSKLLSAVEKLAAAVDKGLDQDIAEAYMDQIAGIGRRIAVAAIAEAIDGGGDPVDIEAAQGELADGDQERANGAYEVALGCYMEAAEKAMAAL